MNKRPLFDSIITTANRKLVTSSGILLVDETGHKGELLTEQTVIRVGDNVPDFIKEGTRVELNMLTFPKVKSEDAKHDVGPDTFVRVPPLYEEEDGTEFMLMSVRNLLYVIED